MSTEKKTLAQMARDNGIKFTPHVNTTFATAKERGLDLTVLETEDLTALNYWFGRYYTTPNEQIENLRKTITKSEKHLALDLVALARGGNTLELAGLSPWFQTA